MRTPHNTSSPLLHEHVELRNALAHVDASPPEPKRVGVYLWLVLTLPEQLRTAKRFALARWDRQLVRYFRPGGRDRVFYGEIIQSLVVDHSAARPPSGHQGCLAIEWLSLQSQRATDSCYACGTSTLLMNRALKLSGGPSGGVAESPDTLSHTISMAQLP